MPAYKGMPVGAADRVETLLPEGCNVITFNDVTRVFCNPRGGVGTPNVGDTIEIDGVSQTVTAVGSATQADIDGGDVLDLEAAS